MSRRRVFYAYYTTEDNSKNKDWTNRSDREGKGLIKIGTSEAKTGLERVREQFKTAAHKNHPDSYFEFVKEWDGYKEDKSLISDKELYDTLRAAYPNCHYKNSGGAEWFEVSPEEIEAVILSIQTGKHFSPDRTATYKLRPSQKEFVDKADFYFKQLDNDDDVSSRSFLLNAKMRFGKCFATYKLAEKAEFKKVLILTYKPSVKESWYSDWSSHKDFEDTLWIDKSSSDDDIKAALESDKTIFAFYSYQDLGNPTKPIKEKHKWIYDNAEWDLIVNDEYHFGAWNDNTKQLYTGISDSETFEESPEESEKATKQYTPGDYGGLKAKRYLYLSGTPFRSIETGEFAQEQIYSWTYADEQEAKREYQQKIDEGLLPDNSNPYKEMPKMCLMTYNLPPEVKDQATNEDGWFSLSALFKAEKTQAGDYIFLNEALVVNFLEYLYNKRSLLASGGSHVDGILLPFKNEELTRYLAHTFWLLPNVASVFAMKRLLERDPFFSKYKVIAVAGDKVGADEAVNMVKKEIKANPLTITLSCGKLSTGSTIPEWTAVFFLSGTNSPETYMQTAFRAGSPWVTVDPHTKERDVVKNIFYVFDFSPSRTLTKIYDLAKLQTPATLSHTDEHGTHTAVEDKEETIAKMIGLMSIYAFDGAEMQELNAEEVLQVIDYGTTSQMAARRWRNPSIVSLSNKQLATLVKDPELVDSISKIIQYRKNKPSVKNTFERTLSASGIASKRKEDGEEMTDKEKREYRQAQKELKEIKDKLIHFIQRIPLFMYFTDDREKTLIDIIQETEGELFIKTTGLSKQEFGRLREAGVFNDQLISEQILRFRLIEDRTLEGVPDYDKKNTETIGTMSSQVHKDDATIIVSS